ncbi:MAG TPA: trypsin-like peptidase domain-containing protein [Polyangiaceae bacterium]|nr:trypsin-like peptidase domain-containing protein [Polyangiaceae bacterium]
MICKFDGEAKRIEVSGVGRVNLLRARAFAKGLASRVELSTASVGDIAAPVVLLPDVSGELDPVEMSYDPVKYKAEYSFETGKLTVTIREGVVKKGRYRGRIKDQKACDDPCDIHWGTSSDIKLVITPAKISEPIQLTGPFPFINPKDPDESLDSVTLTGATGVRVCDDETKELRDVRVEWKRGLAESVNSPTGILVDAGVFRVRVEGSQAPTIIPAGGVEEGQPPKDIPTAGAAGGQRPNDEPRWDWPEDIDKVAAGGVVIALVIGVAYATRAVLSRPKQPGRIKVRPPPDPPPPAEPHALDKAATSSAENVLDSRPMNPRPPLEDYVALNDAMRSAYLNVEELRALLFIRCARNLDDVVAPAGLAVLVPALIQKAIAEGWYHQLLKGVVADRPTNQDVIALDKMRRREIVAETPGAMLERLTRLDLPFLDPLAYSAGLLRSARAVCQIEIDGQPQGTGFLVAPDLILTNHHVIEDLLNGAPAGGPPAGGDRIELLFDRTEGGQTRRAGCAVDWLVASSPASPLDTRPPQTRAGQEPGVDTLDYALLRLSERVADDIKDGAPRGYLKPRVNAQSFRTDAPLQILQHPNGNVLRFRHDTKAIIELNAARTRVRYRTNTDHGSSGAPCFDERWNLVALHHSGTPAFQNADSNEGIPIDTVFNNLPPSARATLNAALGGPPVGGAPQ